ncbi:aspartyl/asparaginyl beta-hydroxylase domain-containing protein [Luteimonas vadosa]|uniref:Aspartyl/asparaginy/proline hydroxylase domain-containing protein n=1 Tax=Luteimonas vadosa TaxID=1165507 RepID=A0ABP9DTB9_9GAMM
MDRWNRSPADMKLQVPFVQLPLSFDAAALAAEVSQVDESEWRPHPQGFAGNSMLPLVAAGGDPANESFGGLMRPTPHLRRCPYLMQVLASLGATVGRTRLMRLAGQAEVTRHADQGYYWAERVRVHVPIVTQPTVRFECGEAVVNMAAGECWIFDTWRQHRVLNDATQSRIHLVADTVGGPGFWDLVSRGRAVPAQGAPSFDIAHVAPREEASRDFACESVNVPRVMNPWELEKHLGFLFGEAVSHPALPTLQQQAGRLLREWRGLWFEHGEADSGRARFRQAFDGFQAAVQGPAQDVVLRNGIRWFDVLQVMLGSVVVQATEAQDAGDPAAQRRLGDNA